VYNPDYAAVKETMDSILEGRYAEEKIKFFASLPEVTLAGTVPNATVLVLTEHSLVHLKPNLAERDKSEVLFRVKLELIQRCEVYRSTQDENYVMLVKTYTDSKGQMKHTFLSPDYYKFEKVYTIVTL
jgi:hypothetical protein